MSLVFDTGLSRSTRELIVGAIAAKLAELKRSNGKYLAAIVPLSTPAGSVADDDFLTDLAKAVQGRVPCVAIATGAEHSEDVGEDASESLDTITLELYIVSGNQRGVVDGRLFVDVGAATDDTKDPGVFAMMQHVRERVQAADLGIPNVHEPRKGDAGPLATFDDVTIWFQSYTVDVDVIINLDRNTTDRMTSIEARHKGDGIPDGSALDPLIDTVTPLDPPT